MQPYQPWHQT